MIFVGSLFQIVSSFQKGHALITRCANTEEPNRNWTSKFWSHSFTTSEPNCPPPPPPLLPHTWPCQFLAQWSVIIYYKSHRGQRMSHALDMKSVYKCCPLWLVAGHGLEQKNGQVVGPPHNDLLTNSSVGSVIVPCDSNCKVRQLSLQIILFFNLSVYAATVNIRLNA